MTYRPATLHPQDFVHGVPAQRSHLGYTTPCGVYTGREQYGARSAMRTVTTRVGDVITCPCCLSGTQWPAQRQAEPALSAARFDFLADGSVVDTYGSGH